MATIIQCITSNIPYKGKTIVTFLDAIDQRFAVVLGTTKLFASVHDAMRFINGRETKFDITVDRLTVERCSEVEKIMNERINK